MRDKRRLPAHTRTAWALAVFGNVALVLLRPNGVLLIPRANISSITTGIESVAKNGDKEAVNSIYDLNGRQQQGLRHGLNIVRMSDGTVKKTMMK